MFFKQVPTRVYWFGFLLIVGISAAFYLLIGQGARRSVTNDILLKQQLLTRAQKSNIQSFFNVFGDSIAVLSQLKTITSGNSAIWDLGVFVEQWRDSSLSDGVALTNDLGIVKFNSNVSGISGEGVSLADRDYFIWAKNEAKIGEYFVGEPVVSRLGASEGRYIIPVASPVYQNGIFKGVLVAAVDLEHLTKNHLQLLKISDQTDVFLMGRDGVLYFSNTMPDSVGANIFDLMRQNPIKGNENLAIELKNALSKDTGGTAKVAYKDPVSGVIENHAIAYSQIDFGNQKWTLVMASPIGDLWNLGVPMYARIIILLLFLAVTFAMYGAIAVKETQKRLK